MTASISCGSGTLDRGVRRLRTACFWALMAAAWAPASAQLGVSGAGVTASAPPPSTAPSTGRPAPRLTNSSDARRSMDLDRNEQSNGKVVPQVRIPLGKPAGAPVLEQRRRGAGQPVTTGGIDDAAARCESETDPKIKAACRDRAGQP